MDPLAKENAWEPAFPIAFPPDRDGNAEVKTGLTKREEIAARIMAAHYASPVCILKAKEAAKNSVRGADALLQALREYNPGE